MLLRLDRIVAGACLVCVTIGSPLAQAAQVADAAGPRQRFIVIARGAADLDALRGAAQRAGGAVDDDLRDDGMLVVSGGALLQSQLQASGLVEAVVPDHVERLVEPDARADLSRGPLRPRIAIDAATSRALANALRRGPAGDPAFAQPGLMWSLDRIDAPQAWQTTTGTGQVRVGVADTGLDFTHAELAPRIGDVVDFTAREDPPLCKTFSGTGDDDLAQTFGGPVRTDWSGHGSWVGGNIAAARDGRGINGTAPDIQLVSLKIAGWCGAAYASTVFKALRYAGNHHIDIVNLSLGSYLDRSKPGQDALWRKYRSVIQKVRDQGTVITVAAGNEHLRIDENGQVISHGLILDASGKLVDAIGLFEVPGGVPGVIDVASTVNVVGLATSHCPPELANDLNAVCKPRSDPHQAQGQGLQDQLAYYSNYGPRIDVAAPGGARKFNLPGLDRGGTPGFPFTSADLTTAYQVFSTTSNWAAVQCFTFSAPAFPVDQCYTDMQGTSMAAPHVAGVLALIASSDPSVRGEPDRLVRSLLSSARKVSGNRTQVWSATDTSPGDRAGDACPQGYCHLGGEAVKDGDAYGAGIVDARRAVTR